MLFINHPEDYIMLCNFPEQLTKYDDMSVVLLEKSPFHREAEGTEDSSYCVGVDTLCRSGHS